MMHSTKKYSLKIILGLVVGLLFLCIPARSAFADAHFGFLSPSPGTTVYTATPQVTAEVTWWSQNWNTVTMKIDNVPIDIGMVGLTIFCYPTLSNGPHTAYVEIGQAGGDWYWPTYDYVGSRTWTFYVSNDSSGPAYSNLNPTNGSLIPYPTASLNISANVTDETAVNWGSRVLTLDGQIISTTYSGSSISGTVNATINPTYGTHTLVLSTADTLGKTSSTTWTFQYHDGNLPAITNPSPTGKVIWDDSTNQTFSADASDATTGINGSTAKFRLQEGFEDNFTDGIIDTDKWAVNSAIGTLSESSGILSYSGKTNTQSGVLSQARSKYGLAGDFDLNLKMRHRSPIGGDVGFFIGSYDDTTPDNATGYLFAMQPTTFSIWSRSGGTWTNKVTGWGSHAQDTWYNLRVVKSGSQWTFYVNGTQIFTESSWSGFNVYFQPYRYWKENVGAGAYGNLEWDDISFYSKARLEDNFNSYIDGDKWISNNGTIGTINPTFSTISSSKTSAQSGVMNQIRSKIGGSDFDLNIKMKRTSAVGGNIGFFIGSYDDTTPGNATGYLFAMQPTTFSIWSRSGGTWTNKVTGWGSHSQNIWYNLRVVKSGSQWTFYVNGTQIFTENSWSDLDSYFQTYRYWKESVGTGDYGNLEWDDLTFSATPAFMNATYNSVTGKIAYSILGSSVSFGINKAEFKVKDNTNNEAVKTWWFTKKYLDETTRTPAPNTTVCPGTISMVATAGLTAPNDYWFEFPISIDGQTYSANYNSGTGLISYTPPTPLSTGTHTVTITVNLCTTGLCCDPDIKTPIESTTWSFNVESTPPAISNLVPANRTSFTSPTGIINISANISDDSGIVENSRVLTITGPGYNNVILSTAYNAVDAKNGAISTSLPYLSKGLYRFSLSISDIYGNITTDTWSYVVDGEFDPPTFDSYNPADGSTVEVLPGLITVSVRVSDPSGIYAPSIITKVNGFIAPHSFDSSSGIISFKPWGMSYGSTASISVTAADNYDNTATTSWSFTSLDNMAPRITNLNPASGVTVGPQVSTISCVATDANIYTYDLYENFNMGMWVDGAQVTPTLTMVSGGISFSHTLPSTLPAGPHSARIWVTDHYNHSTDYSWTFNVETTPPTISNMVPANNEYVTSSANPITISAKASDTYGVDGNSRVLKLDGNVISSSLTDIDATSGTVSTTMNIAPGWHTISLSIADKNGNITETSWKIRVTETVGPTVSEMNPTGELAYSNTKPQIRVRVQDPNEIDAESIILKINGSKIVHSYEADSSTSGLVIYLTGAPLPVGTNIVEVTVKDGLGNSTVSSWQFNINSLGDNVHGDYASHQDACMACHETHKAHGKKLLNKDLEKLTCFYCHDGKQTRSSLRDEFGDTGSGTSTKVSHHKVPEGNMRCSDCHNPHAKPSGKANLLSAGTNKVSSGNAYCGVCHQSINASIAATSHGNTSKMPNLGRNNITCLKCHEEHASDYVALLRDPVTPAADIEKAITGNNSTLCEGCHSGKVGAYESDTIFDQTKHGTLASSMDIKTILHTSQADFEKGALTNLAATLNGDLELLKTSGVDKIEDFEDTNFAIAGFNSNKITTIAPHSGKNCYSLGTQSLELNVSLPEAGSISFWYKTKPIAGSISVTKPNVGYLIYYFDYSTSQALSYTNPNGYYGVKIRGTAEWTYYTIPLPAGNHSIKLYTDYLDDITLRTNNINYKPQGKYVSPALDISTGLKSLATVLWDEKDTPKKEILYFAGQDLTNNVTVNTYVLNGLNRGKVYTLNPITIDKPCDKVTLSWTENMLPVAFQCESRLSTNGGQTWTEWVSVGRDQAVPGIDKNTVNALLQFRVYAINVHSYDSTGAYDTKLKDMLITKYLADTSESTGPNYHYYRSAQDFTDNGSFDHTTVSQGGIKLVKEPYTYYDEGTPYTDYFYVSNGTYLFNPVAISHYLGHLKATWNADTTVYTTVGIERRISNDGGLTWSNWAHYNKDTLITGIDKNAANPMVQFKVKFYTSKTYDQTPSLMDFRLYEENSGSATPKLVGGDSYYFDSDQDFSNNGSSNNVTIANGSIQLIQDSELLYDSEWGYYGHTFYRSPGTYTLKPLTISKGAEKIKVSWNADTPSSTGLEVQTRYSTDDGETWSLWTATTNGGLIPGINKAVTNTLIQCQVILHTNSDSNTPKLNDIIVTTVNSQQSPVRTNLSLDGGKTWRGWSAVTNGGFIPGIDGKTDLSKARLKYEIDFASYDFKQTPSLEEIKILLKQSNPLATVVSALTSWPGTGKTGCGNCHDPHGNGNANGLRASGITLCTNCHDSSSITRPAIYSYRGITTYASSGHGNPTANAKCTDCHNPHGSAEGSSGIPIAKQLKGEEGYTCFNGTCHRGNNGTADIYKTVNANPDPAAHHSVNTDEQAAKGTKVQCENCHNPHLNNAANKIIDPDNPLAFYKFDVNNYISPGKEIYVCVSKFTVGELLTNEMFLAVDYLASDSSISTITYKIDPNGTDGSNAWNAYISTEGMVLPSLPLPDWFQATAEEKTAITASESPTPVYWRTHWGMWAWYWTSYPAQVFKFKLQDTGNILAVRAYWQGNGVANYSDYKMYLWNFTGNTWVEKQTENTSNPAEAQVLKFWLSVDGFTSYCLKCHDNTPPAGVKMGETTNIQDALTNTFADNFFNSYPVPYNNSAKGDAHGTGWGSADLIKIDGTFTKPGQGELKAPYSWRYPSLSCATCHDQHGSSNVYHLREKVNGNTVTGLSEGDQEKTLQFCMGCHSSTKQTTLDRLSEFHNGCMKCHNNDVFMIGNWKYKDGEHVFATKVNNWIYHVNGPLDNPHEPYVWNLGSCLDCHRHGEVSHDHGCVHCGGGIEGRIKQF